MLINLNYYVSDFLIVYVFKPVSALHLHSHLIYKYYHRKYFVYKALKNTHTEKNSLCCIFTADKQNSMEKHTL